MPRREEDVIVGVGGTSAFEDLEVVLLPNLGVHLYVGLSRRRGHQSFQDAGRGAACQLESGRARLPRMRLLALETATLAGGAALLDDGRLVGESRLNIALTHSERLMAVVDRLLQDCGWEMSTVRGLAVSIGPGSFTGLRVGAATAK